MIHPSGFWSSIISSSGSALGILSRKRAAFSIAEPIASRHPKLPVPLRRFRESPLSSQIHNTPKSLCCAPRHPPIIFHLRRQPKFGNLTPSIRLGRRPSASYATTHANHYKDCLEPPSGDIRNPTLGISRFPLWALATGNQELADALRRTLLAVATNQTSLGRIPSLANDSADRGASDTTLLFLFGLAL